MDSELKTKFELFVENKQQIAKAYPAGKELNFMNVSLILSGLNKPVDIDKLNEVKEILASKAGFFSSMRVGMEMTVSAKMYASGSPERYIDDILELHDKLLGKRIIDYYSFTVAAMAMVDLGRINDAEQVIERSREILSRMRRVHPILADENDITFTTLLAMTGKDTDTVIREMESCYAYFKKTLKIKAESDAIQSLCELIILSDGDLTAKCDKAAALFNAFTERRMRYSSTHEFASIGALVNLDMSVDEIVNTVIGIAEEMKNNPGFGDSKINVRDRLMFSALLLAKHVTRDKEPAFKYLVNTGADCGKPSLIIEEEVVCHIVAMAVAAQSASDDYVPLPM